MQNNRHYLILSTYDDIKNPYYGGGGAIAIHELAKRLASQYTVRVLSWNYSGKTNEVIDGVVYERFGFASLSPKVAMFAYQVFLPLQVLSRKYDVWLESFCPPFTTAVLPLFTRRPVIGIVHMLAAEDMERKYKLPFHLIENFGIKRYKNIVVTSPLMRDKIKKIIASSRIAVISNGIVKVAVTNFSKEKYILFLGRIEVDQKGLDLLIFAYTLFAEKNKQYRLIIAGDGDVQEVIKLKELVKRSGLEDLVQLLGKVSGDQKEKLFQRASCVVVSSRFETYSLVALEALAHGAPLVCFTIDGLSWVPKKIAMKVKAFDTLSLSEAIEKIVTNTRLANSMGKEGKNYAKRFTWDAVAGEYETFIQDILRTNVSGER